MRQVLTAVLILIAQHGSAAAELDAWKPLHFLEGTWDAKTTGGSAGAQSRGVFTFVRELKGHVLARHSESAGRCQGPQDFDCRHSDLFYIYEEGPDQPLKAIYFDNEGHVIHYEVSVPDPETVIFESPKSTSAPQFRLTYKLHDNVMTGKFQMRMPAQADWTAYLEWSGAKHPSPSSPRPESVKDRN